jgi:hypothetical protein
MYQSQQISGAALAAFMPTFTSENGFKGANAQIATLAPYGTAAVSMIALSFASDWHKNRGWYVNFGFVLMIAGFGIYLGVPASNHAARFAALIFAEAGHYSEHGTGPGRPITNLIVSTPLILVWLASNCGNESRRAVAIPLANSVAQAVAYVSLRTTNGLPADHLALLRDICTQRQIRLCTNRVTRSALRYQYGDSW